MKEIDEEIVDVFAECGIELDRDDADDAELLERLTDILEHPENYQDDE